MAGTVEVYEGAVDRGLEGVVACTTAISSIVDATLCYRGYTIEDLAENATFEEVAFLLWYGKLPNQSDLQAFKKEVATHMVLKDDHVKLLQALPTKNVHPMAWLRTATSMLALWDDESQSSDPEVMKRVAIRLLAKMGPLVALFERTRTGKPFVQANPQQSVAWNFLTQLRGEPPSAEIVRMFDVCLTLHADHELNCSAFSSRVTISSLSDIYSAIVSGIGTLKGPLHGGANEQVMRMLKDIGTTDNAKTWIKEALEQKKKIMGFGHRVYKNGDPRAKILKSLSQQITKMNKEEKWFEMSELIDNTVQSEKGLLPNVDFYSATVYYSMGIPLDLYTPIFAVSRVSGWLAHIFEQLQNNRIYRPRGKWVGKEGLKYVPVDQRS